MPAMTWNFAAGPSRQATGLVRLSHDQTAGQEEVLATVDVAELDKVGARAGGVGDENHVGTLGEGGKRGDALRGRAARVVVGRGTLLGRAERDGGNLPKLVRGDGVRDAARTPEPAENDAIVRCAIVPEGQGGQARGAKGDPGGAVGDDARADVPIRATTEAGVFDDDFHLQLVIASSDEGQEGLTRKGKTDIDRRRAGPAAMSRVARSAFVSTPGLNRPLASRRRRVAGGQPARRASRPSPRERPRRFLRGPHPHDCDACRWIAPDTFTRVGVDAVGDDASRAREHARATALRALLSCPTSSIHLDAPADEVKRAHEDFPRRLRVSASTTTSTATRPRPRGCFRAAHLGVHSRSSYGAAPCLIALPDGRGCVMVDCPRWTP